MPAKKKKVEVEEEPVPTKAEVKEQPVPTKATAKEEPAKKAVPLEDQILEIYNEPTFKTATALYFAKRTGASIEEVSLAWHRLFDKGKVPFVNLARR